MFALPPFMVAKLVSTLEAMNADELRDTARRLLAGLPPAQHALVGRLVDAVRAELVAASVDRA